MAANMLQFNLFVNSCFPILQMLNKNQVVCLDKSTSMLQDWKHDEALSHIRFCFPQINMVCYDC